MATTVSASDVLTFFGLTNPPYSAERVSTTTSKNKYASAKDKTEYDDQEWVIYRTDSKTKKKEKMALKSFESNNKSFNACSIKGEQGIIITNKKKFIAEKHKGSMGADSTTSSYEFTDGGFGSYSMGADAGAMAGWLEATDYGPKGHDEKIVQTLQFTKVNLIKECFEWVGINLSAGAPNMTTNSKMDYWE